RLWQQSVFEHVEGADTVAATLLHRDALEKLRLTAQEQEVAADGKAEGADAATFLEEVPECVAIDSELRLVEVPGVCTGGSRHEAHRVLDDDAVSVVCECDAFAITASERKRSKRAPRCAIGALIHADRSRASCMRHDVGSVAGPIGAAGPAREDLERP